MSYALPQVSPLLGDAILVVSGRDSRAFLHAQLTQDILELEEDRHTLAAWADARGRVRALYRVVPAGDRWLLVTSADLVAQLLPKLRLFVLRAQVVIEHVASLQAHAIIGDPSAWQTDQGLKLPSEANAARFDHGIYWLCIAPRLIHAIGAADDIRTACHALEQAPASAAELAAIRHGLPAVDATLTERYIPQMLSLDKLGAVAFDKGCYPGQEIIARTHHLGAVKRRLRRFGSAATVIPARGTSIRAANAAEAGQVIRAAPAARGIELLAVAQVDARAETLRVEGLADAALADLGLPYS